MKVIPDPAEGVTFYQARNNGLSDWDGQECIQCELVFTKMDDGYRVLHCDFNLGLRKVVPNSGDPYYEMELVHYGDKFSVPNDQKSLIFNVDGQMTSFTKNADTGGVFYDVTLDQLQEICDGKTVLVQIIGENGSVEKGFTMENKIFFQRFLYDPNADGLPQLTPTDDQKRIIIPNTHYEYDETDSDERVPRREQPRSHKTPHPRD